MQKQISLAALVSMLAAEVRGTSVLSAEIETEPDMRKTGNPYVGNVVKKQKLNGLVGFDYEAGVNRLAAKEGAEQRDAKPRAWGTLSADRIFVCKLNDGVPTHLRMKVEKSIDPRFFDRSTGAEIARETLAPFLPAKRKSSTQADLQGEVVERDVTLENVKVVFFRGNEYVIGADALAIAAEAEAVNAEAVAAENWQNIIA